MVNPKTNNNHDRSVGAVDEPLGQTGPAGHELGFGLPDDRILSEVSHELGNYFHKLHYWIDYVKSEIAPDLDSEENGLEMLEDTTERLEGFLRMTMEYFSPPRLSFDSVRVDQLVEGISKRLKRRRLVVEGGAGWTDTRVMVDVSLMSHVVRTIVDQLGRTLGDKDTMTLELKSSTRGEYSGMEFEFVAGETVADGTKLISGIEMAVAQKFIQVHGGELFERSGADRRVVVFLPLYE